MDLQELIGTDGVCVRIVFSTAANRKTYVPTVGDQY